MSEFIDSRPWLAEYPPGVPVDIDTSAYSSLVDLLDQTFTQFADRTAFTMMGRDMTFAELDQASKALAVYLQKIGLQRGDRVAVMVPNILQDPIAAMAFIRAGRVLVNVNPR